MLTDTIAFFDIEVGVYSKKINKLGLFVNDEKLSSSSVEKIINIFEKEKPEFICGHNFIKHDKYYLSKTKFQSKFKNILIIDTLYLSMILFVNKKTHSLNKPYKTTLNIENDPLCDAEQTKYLFILLDETFNKLDKKLKNIFVFLLYESEYFIGYFKYKNISFKYIDVYEIIEDNICCTKDEFNTIIENSKIEVAFIVAYIYAKDKASISSVVLHRYPKIVSILRKITFKKSMFDKDKLKELAINEFKFNDNFEFRDFESNSAQEDGLFAKNISQLDIINTSLDDSSLLAILPTGGGKTFTFQLPAIIKAKAYKGLSVVISPLQALMKNHTDSFKEKNQNFKVIAISGYLSPIERMNAITEVENGVVDILYLAPESLRSNSIFKALKKRFIERFIIDEAHCFSSWGHDFRHDYYFIAKTIKELEETSKFQPKIPVSCFTATAKPEVLKDIKEYFFNHLEIELKEIIASSERYNLKYRVIETIDKKSKYETLIKELKQNEKKPTIIYIPHNARECKELSEQLSNDERLSEFNLIIEPFYSKIDMDIENKKRIGRNKSEILKDFMSNEINIVIATTAFGMGIDKSDIETIIHYEQSDSLESYLQESGRGGRDENIEAQCIALYSRQDFDKPFNQLNLSKVDLSEIQRIAKELKKFKNRKLYLSPKDIARKMGIDTEDSKIDYEGMIKTALLELEKYNIIERGRNGYKIYATSISENKNMEAVHDILDSKQDEYKDIYQYMILLMQNIIQRSKIDVIEVDELSDIIGIERKIIFNVLYALQKEKLLEFNNDISVYVRQSVKEDFIYYFNLEQKILEYIDNQSPNHNEINLRDMNSSISKKKKNNIYLFKAIIQSWTHLSKLKSNIFKAYFRKNICHIEILPENKQELKNLITIRKKTCSFIVDKMIEKLEKNKELEVEISSNQLKLEFEEQQKLSLEGFHHSLVYLHELLNSFKLRKGRLIYYKTLQIDIQKNLDEFTPYKAIHYKESLKPYYERKIESIHIQIFFLEKLLKNGWDNSLDFIRDYFKMEYKKFKNKYKLKNIKLPITQEKFKQIVEDLNDEQKDIFEDKKSKSIMVLAGPGSGKTKILVHKIASLITIENNKPEYFLMLAHSRVAVLEFRNRLRKLIGSMVYDIKILTFHAFAISLQGKNIDENNEMSNVISQTTDMIKNEEIEIPYISTFVLDEYQDVSDDTYQFIKEIYSKMSDDKKIIAVGDDDQCINNFGKHQADIMYINMFKNDFMRIDSTSDENNFTQYDLLNNYRSRKNIVELLNKFNKTIPDRLKSKPLMSHSANDGDINLIKYDESNNYYVNVYKNVIINESNNISILARTNDEVLSLYSMLIENNIKAKYITGTDGFSLGNLIELNSFLLFWKESKTFKSARNKLEAKYVKSKNYFLANLVIDKFEEEYSDDMSNAQNHFIGVFEQYLKEITFDEFDYSKAKVTVCTMHKSKGKEWDDVYICVKNNFIQNDYDTRLLYVAISRAKNNLFIHTQDNIFDDFITDKTIYNTKDLEPKRIVFMMSLGDIALSDKDSKIGIEYTNPIAGEIVNIKTNKYNKLCIFKGNNQISKLSKIDSSKPDRLSTKIDAKQQKGYLLEEKAEIEYVVLWNSKENSESFSQILCKVYMFKEL